MTREDIVRPAFLVLWLALALAAYYLLTELTMLIICLIAAITLAAAIAPFARSIRCLAGTGLQPANGEGLGENAGTGQTAAPSPRGGQ